MLHPEVPGSPSSEWLVRGLDFGPASGKIRQLPWSRKCLVSGVIVVALVLV